MSKQVAYKSSQQILDIVRQNCETKNAKRGLKMLGKKADVSYMLALPGLVVDAVNTYDLVGVNQCEFNILIHAGLTVDCVDFYRWFALIPFLLERKSLRVNVVVVCEENNDTQTHFRKVIDYLIHYELKSNFSSDIIIGKVSQVIDEYGDDYFQLIVNNIPQKKDFLDKLEVDALKRLVSKGIPYLISDFCKFSLHYRYNFLKLCGFKTEHLSQVNRLGLSFKKNPVSHTFYRHSGEYLLLDQLDEDFEFDSTLINELGEYEPYLIDRLNKGDPLDFIPFVEKGILHLMNDVNYDLESHIVKLSLGGDNYSFKMDGLLIFPAECEYESSDIDAEKVIISLHFYKLFLAELERLNLGVAS